MGRQRVTALLAVVLLAGSGVRVPAQQVRSFSIDREASTVGFTISHFRVSEVFGEFREFTGEIAYGGSPASFDVSGRVVVSSIDTGIDARDRALMGESYFNESQYPELRFRTLRVEPGSPGEGGSASSEAVLVGELRIRSVTRELRFPVRIDRPGPETIEISIRGSFDRNTFNVRGGFGSAAIGDEVGVRVDLVARRE
jgi:polyisoprenoid-binding protein YceI